MKFEPRLMNDSLQHLLHAVEPEFTSLDAAPAPPPPGAINVSTAPSGLSAGPGPVSLPMNVPISMPVPVTVPGMTMSLPSPRNDLTTATNTNTNTDVAAAAAAAGGSSASTAITRKRPAPRGTAAYPRKRANKACQVCRARRTKCDNKKPSCSFCEKVGAKCITTPTDLSSFDPASLAILERLGQLEELIRVKSGDESPDRSRLDDELLLDEKPTLPPREYREFSTVTIETVLAWPVFRNKFALRLDLKSLLKQKDAAPPAASLHSPASDNWHSVNVVELGMCNRLLDSFLHRVHIANPILDVPAVRGYVRHACLNGLGRDAQSCLVLLLCALGAIAEVFHGKYESKSIIARHSQSFALAMSYFRTAKQTLGLLLHADGVLEAQCFFYSGVYLMTLQRPMEAWRYFVQAAAISQGFDFPKKPTGHEAMASPEARSARTSQESMYWTCLKSELEVRIELSLPGFGLQDLSYHTFFPSPPSENLENESARAWYYYLAEIALRRLANRILYDLFRNQDNGRFPHIIDMVDSAAGFEAQATDWMASLPPMFSLETPEESDDVLKFVLRGHLLDCYEWMYFPFMAEVINYGRRGQIVDEYARKGLQMSVDRIRKNQPGFKHRHHGAWLMLRTCTRSALILLAACHSESAQDLIPKDWRDAVLNAMDMLRFWEDEVHDARDRLQILTQLMTELGYRA